MADNTTATSFQAAAYTSQGTAREKVALPEDAVRRHREHAGDAPGGEGVPRQPAPGQRVDEDPQVRDGRQPEAVEAEGHRTRSRRARPARRTGWAAVRCSVRSRAATRSTCRARCARSPARARSTRAPARTRSSSSTASSTMRRRRRDLRRCSCASGSADQKVLILTDGVKPNVFLSGRNLPTVHVLPYSDVSTYHILWSDVRGDRGAARSARRSRRSPKSAKRRARRRAPRRMPRPRSRRRRRPPRRRPRRPRRSRPRRQPAKTAAKTAAKKAAKKPAAKKAAAKKPARSRPRRRGSNQCRPCIAPSCVR